MGSEDNSLRFVEKCLRDGKVAAVHLEGCPCVVCTYDYPNKEYIIELQHSSRSMPSGTVIPKLKCHSCQAELEDWEVRDNEGFCDMCYK